MRTPSIASSVCLREVTLQRCPPKDSPQGRVFPGPSRRVPVALSETLVPDTEYAFGILRKGLVHRFEAVAHFTFTPAHFLQWPVVYCAIGTTPSALPLALPCWTGSASHEFQLVCSPPSPATNGVP